MIIQEVQMQASYSLLWISQQTIDSICQTYGSIFFCQLLQIMLIPSLRQILPLFLVLVTTTKIADSAHSQLANIDRSIKSLSNSVSSLCPEKKYTLRFDGHATVEVLETVKIPSKKETSIPALLRVNRSLFVTVSGEEVFRVSQKALVASARNDFMFLLEGTEIKHLEVQNKQCFLKHSTNLLNLTHNAQNQKEFFTAFDTAMVKGKRVFLLGTVTGQLHIYSRKGFVEKVQNLSNSPIRQLLKLPSNLIFRSDQELGIVTLLSDRAAQICQLPLQPIESLGALEDQRLYIKAGNWLYIYKLFPCKPISKVWVPKNSSVNGLADLLVVKKTGSEPSSSVLILNSSSNFEPKVYSFNNKSQQILTFKRSQHQYSLVTISHNSKLQTELIFYMYQPAQTSSSSSGFGVKGFKAPIFLVSIGIVFYCSMRMRKKEEVSQETPKNVHEKAKELAELVEVAQTTRLLNPSKGLTQEQFEKLVMEQYEKQKIIAKEKAAASIAAGSSPGTLNDNKPNGKTNIKSVK